jgi:ParB-like chromosome segregation protein Spo0J
MANSANLAPKTVEIANSSAKIVENWDIGRLKPYTQNARTHSDEQVDRIAASIIEFGWTIPVLAAPDGTIIAGHGRVAAAQKLGLAEVPVLIAEDWTESQRRAYTIADNLLPLGAGWDVQGLQSELLDLMEENFDLDVLGFEPGELDKALGTGDDIYSPNLTPRTDAHTVSQQTLERARAGLDGQFQAAAKQNLTRIACPHCNEWISINKDAL